MTHLGANRAAALLIVAATILFVIGVSIERSDEHTEPATASVEESEHAESGLEEAGHAGETGGEKGERETLLGVDLESTPFVVLAVIASLVLVAGAWARPDMRGLLELAVIAMLAFAALDLREIFHQLDESNGGVAALAGAVALLHLGAAGLSARAAQAR